MFAGSRAVHGALIMVRDSMIKMEKLQIVHAKFHFLFGFE